jgi:hypothetical protein
LKTGSAFQWGAISHPCKSRRSGRPNGIWFRPTKEFERELSTTRSNFRCVIDKLISDAEFKMDTKTYSDGGSAKKFRDYAAECRRMAAQSASEKDRMVLMEIAQAWTVCAEEAERKTRRASPGVNE